MRERLDETAQALAREGNPAGGQIDTDSGKCLDLVSRLRTHLGALKTDLPSC